jgi:signal transduction histidine kinase
MLSRSANTDSLKPNEFGTIYEISRVILQSVDPASALKEIVRLSRPIFIFDNIVLFQLQDDQTLHPTYARAIGRGRSAEADMSWGDTIAAEVLKEKDILIRQEKGGFKAEDPMSSRLNSRFFLGLPLCINGGVNGALIFIRFGGPVYMPEQINLAKLIAEHVEQLLEKQHLGKRVASLEAERQLDRLQQDFVATISHDLRTPLGFIKGYATTLLREDAEWDRETRREFLTIIDEEADRLAELIDNLLDSSRLQSGALRMEFQPVHLASLLKDLVQRIQGSDYNIQVELDLEISKDTVYADPTRLIQVFNNLFSNAEKYAPNSVVTVSLDWLKDGAQISIRDTGPGIPQNQLENIFKRFYRLPEHSDYIKGSGLGLFICRQIIQAHHGEIFAESEIGKGTTFKVKLPRKQPSAQQDANQLEV